MVSSVGELLNTYEQLLYGSFCVERMLFNLQGIRT